MLLLAPVFVLLYPFLIILMYVSWWFAYRRGQDVKLTDQGIQVFSRAKGNIIFIAWSQIKLMKELSEPPILYPALILQNGAVVHLTSANFDSLAQALRPHEIPIFCRRKGAVSALK
jgi:predicted permease